MNTKIHGKILLVFTQNNNNEPPTVAPDEEVEA